MVGGVEINDWIFVVLAGFTTFGVALAPAVSDNGIGNTPSRTEV